MTRAETAARVIDRMQGKPDIYSCRKELIRTWRRTGFTLRIWDTYTSDHNGRRRLAYEFKDGRTVVFAGTEFTCPITEAIDSLAVVVSILGFFALEEGDIEADYFENYTQAQLEWRDSGRCGDLNMILYAMGKRQ